MGDDVHNPFTDRTVRKERREPGVFDPDYKPKDDPFKQPPDDSQWDEPDEPPSTRDA